MLIEKKQKIGAAMWVMVCPKCGKIQASACYRSWLPDCTWCSCDINVSEDEAKQPIRDKNVTIV